MDDDLSPEIILQNLKTQFIGQKIIYFPILDSTMEAARREALWGAEAGTVIIAEQQSGGRGRLQRKWISPRGGLALSIILRPNIDHLPYMIMISSLAVVNSIQAITSLNPQIKWPNDILINEKKICGILIENDLRQNSLHHAIIGIGINVNMHISDYPEIASFATSLSDQLGREISKLDLLRQVLIEMERLYQLLSQKEYILAQWKDNLITLGQSIEINMGNKIYKGIAESVSKEGNLLLRQKNGTLVRIVAGDVTLR